MVPTVDLCISQTVKSAYDKNTLKKVEELHLDLSPSVVFSDFEPTIIWVADLSFPTANIRVLLATTTVNTSTE